MSSDPWGNASTAQENKDSSVDWGETQASTPIEEETSFNLLNPFEEVLIPFDDWTNDGNL